MLIKCPECELQVSDKAISCPHCGYPLQSQISFPKRRSSKRRRLPNGFGQISELKNPNLRKPFRAMVTVGTSETGKPICKLLKPVSYFESYNEAYEALVIYNKNPYSLDKDMTLKELYERWTSQYFKNASKSVICNTESAWHSCFTLQKIKVADIRARHVKSAMENTENPGLKRRIKCMFNLMLDYAVDYELIPVNYARSFKLDRKISDEIDLQSKVHISFTDDELNTLWDHQEDKIAMMILIQCYTGFRPQELCQLRLEDVHIDKKYIVGGMKTKAGRNRVVPIHHRIQPLIEKLLNERIERVEDRKDLFVETDACNGMVKSYNYRHYKYQFDVAMKKYNLNTAHRPHDPRKQFVTMAKRAGVDDFAIKKIVGHAISDITEKIYTDRDSNWIFHEIEKIP